MRQFDKQRIAIVLGSAAVLAAGAALWVNRSGSRSAPPEVAAALEAAKEALRAAPVISISNRPEIMRAIDAGVEVHDADLNEMQRDALTETIGDIFRLIADADAHAYAEWMRTRGYALRPIASMPQHVVKTYENLSPAPPASAFDIFQTLFESSLMYKGGRSTPAGIMDGHSQVRVDVAYTGTDTTIWDMLRNQTDTDWTLGDIQNGYGFWRPDRSRESLVGTDGGALTARVLMGVSTAGGDAPLRIGMSLYYDPQSSQWRIEDMMYFLYSYGRSSGQEFAPGPYY